MIPNAIILDTNLLLLLIVGTADRAYIGKHRRLQGYSDADFTILVTLISSSPKIVVTPNTLTETSNLLRYIAEPARTHLCEFFRIMITAAGESYIESSRAAGREEFPRLGLADAVLLELADRSHTLLTADLDLYLAALARGFSAENFNHYRAM